MLKPGPRLKTLQADCPSRQQRRHQFFQRFMIAPISQLCLGFAVGPNQYVSCSCEPRAANTPTPYYSTTYHSRLTDPAVAGSVFALAIQYSATPLLQDPLTSVLEPSRTRVGPCGFAVVLLLMALLGGALIFLFPGFPEQDSGYHFVMAHTAWHQPAYFVNVWARPLYTLAFYGPALLGLRAARFFALAISLLVAWQTWKLALDLRLERAWLSIPLLLAQPTFFELFTDLLTEPLFALIFVAALRLHLRGRTKMGMLWLRKHASITTAWLLFFLLHSVFRAYGLFGEAGYPRYMVSVAPATAVITLVGWNIVASWRNAWFRPARPIMGSIVIAGSLLISFLYLDSLIWTRDFVAIREMLAWFEQNRRTVRGFIWSDVGMCIQTNNDLSTAPALSEDRERNLEVLQDAPRQTLVFWDDDIGPKWFGLNIQEIQNAGFQLLPIRHYTLPGVVVSGQIGGWQLTRETELSLLYKP